MTADAGSKDLPQLIHLTLTQRKDLTAARLAAAFKLRRSPEWCNAWWQQQYYMPTRLHQSGRRLNSLSVAVYRRQKRNCR